MMGCADLRESCDNGFVAISVATEKVARRCLCVLLLCRYLLYLQSFIGFRGHGLRLALILADHKKHAFIPGTRYT